MALAVEVPGFLASNPHSMLWKRLHEVEKILEKSPDISSAFFQLVWVIRRFYFRPTRLSWNMFCFTASASASADSMTKLNDWQKSLSSLRFLRSQPFPSFHLFRPFSFIAFLSQSFSIVGHFRQHSFVLLFSIICSPLPLFPPSRYKKKGCRIWLHNSKKLP